MNLLLPTVLIVLGGCVPPAALGPPPPTIGGSAPQGGMVTGRLHDVTPSQPSIDGWWVDGELWTDMVAGPLVLRPVVGFGYRDYGGGYQQSPLGGVMGADAWLPVTRGRLSVGLMAGAGVLYGRGGVFGQYQADAWRLALIGYGSGSVLFELGLLGDNSDLSYGGSELGGQLVIGVIPGSGPGRPGATRPEPTLTLQVGSSDGYDTPFGTMAALSLGLTLREVPLAGRAEDAP